MLEAMRDVLREHYRDIARKTEYREYFAPSSSLILIYSMDMASNPRTAVAARFAAYFSYTSLYCALCLSLLSLLSCCIAGYTLSLVIHRIQSELIICKP